MRTFWFHKSVVTLFLVGSALLGAGPRAGADEVDTTKTNEAYLVKGELITLKADGVTRLSVTNPEVADIVKADEKEVLMVGQSVGQTELFIWDKQGKRSITVYVLNQNLEQVKERMVTLFKAADITEVTLEIDGREEKVVASGNIPKYKKEQFTQIVEKFGGDVLNLVKDEEVDDLVQIDVQITELSSTLSKSLGIEWFTGTQSTSGNNITTTSSGGLTPSYGERMPSFDGSIGDYFKIGQFERTVDSALLAKINALLQEGKARVLSQPKLVVRSGQDARFLVGGEIPIRTSISTLTGGTGQISEQVTFKEYGISMNITPEIRKEKIDITLNVEIKDIDSANAVGNTVAFTSRSVQTKLYLDDGQTIVMAGLIKQNKSVRVKKVPFLGDIPVLGVLFRNKSTPTDNQDQELVISLTPTVLQKNRGKIPVIAEKQKANNKESIVGTVSADVSAQHVPALSASSTPVPVDEHVPSIPQKIVPAPPAQESNPAAVPQPTSAQAAPEASDATSVASDVTQAAVVPDTEVAQEPSSGVEEVVPVSEVQAPPAQESNPAAVPQPTSAQAAPEPAAVPFSKDMSEYVEAVHQKITQAIVYPQEAEQSGLEGTVKLGLLILNDGTLATAMVRESSGHEVFDDYTLSIARKLAPYSSFPSDVHLRELNLTIPVVYSLKKNNEL